LNATQEEYLNDVLGSSKHLLSLINDILDLSKVEAGKLELEPSAVNIRDMLVNSTVMIKEKALKQGIRIKIDHDGIPESIDADERKLKQVLYNLLSNAVKFTPQNGSILLAAEICSKDKKIQDVSNSTTNYLKISVEDSGVGLKNKDLEKIFEPFEQVKSSASGQIQGTGLGLSLTKRLVELHGGNIWAESGSEGHGAKFSFTLPLSNNKE
jgi:signal transduction histidine kinase